MFHVVVAKPLLQTPKKTNSAGDPNRAKHKHLNDFSTPKYCENLKISVASLQSARNSWRNVSERCIKHPSKCLNVLLSYFSLHSILLEANSLPLALLYVLL